MAPFDGTRFVVWVPVTMITDARPTKPAMIVRPGIVQTSPPLPDEGLILPHAPRLSEFAW